MDFKYDQHYQTPTVGDWNDIVKPFQDYASADVLKCYHTLWRVFPLRGLPSEGRYWP